MKRAIILFAIVVLSYTTLHSQEYFTAKQGIATALEAARNYFKDSVTLNFINRVELKWIKVPIGGIKDSIWCKTINDTMENNNSNHWYYNICNKDSCRSFRLIKRNKNFVVDSIFIENIIRAGGPIDTNDINIDSDSLLYCAEKCNFERIVDLFVLTRGSPFDLEWLFDNEHIYNDNAPIDFFGDILSISAKTGECEDIKLPVKEAATFKNDFKIKYDYNTNNIIITSQNINTDAVRLRIYDQLGNLVKTENIQSNNYELNTHNFTQGLYIVQLFTNKDLITKPILIYH
ncbi:MAG: T9SS type A sorting domain-containing protein [FCB group bacterium]|jgi:hypothetical protein